MENIFEKIKEKFGCAVAYMSNSAKSKLEKSKLIKKSVPFVLGITLATIQLTGCSNEKNIVEENITFENEPSFDKKDNKPIQEHTVTEEELSEILIDESITFENEPSLTEDTEYCQIDLKETLLKLLESQELDKKTKTNLVDSITEELKQYGNPKFYMKESDLNTVAPFKITIYIISDELSNPVINSMFQILYGKDGGFGRFLVHLYGTKEGFGRVSYDWRNNETGIEKCTLYKTAGAEYIEYFNSNDEIFSRKLYCGESGRILCPFSISLSTNQHRLTFKSEDYDTEESAEISVYLNDSQFLYLENMFEQYKTTASFTSEQKRELTECLYIGYQEEQQAAYKFVEEGLQNYLTVNRSSSRTRTPQN